MATLKVQIGVPISSKILEINTEDYIPNDEWEEMLGWQQEAAVQEWVDGLEQPVWVVETITENA